mgnify:FL=1
MAIPSKKNIDFDVYERQDPKTRVDWGAQAAKITKTFEGIRDERQGRKDLLEKNITEQQAALNDIGQYDSQTLRQVALDSSQQSADELARKAALMRAGKIKPNDLMKFKSNQSAGWTQFKNNAEQWDSKFQELTTRTNDGLNSKAERELAELTSSFGNLKNMKFLTDDEGNMAYARTDDDGNILTGESVSANEMTNLLNQRINSYKASDAANAQGKKIGVLVTEMLTENGINATIRSDARSRAESDFLGGAKAQETLNLFAKEMTSNPSNLAVMMVDNNMVNGVQYENNYIGGPADEGDMHAGYTGDPSKNPFIKWVHNGNYYVPQVTEEQRTAGDQYAEDLIKATLDIKIGVDTKGMNEKDQESAAGIADRKLNEEIDASGQSVNMLVTGDPAAAEAAAKDLISSFENLENIERVVDANGNVTSFNIQVRKPGEDGELLQVDPISTTDPEGNAKTPDEIMREIFKLVGAKGTYDAWYKRNKDSISENIGKGSIVSKRAAPVIERTIQPNEVLIPGADGKLGRQSYTDFFASKEGGNLGNSISSDPISMDYNEDVVKAFNNLIKSRNFIPKDLKTQLDDAGKKYEAEINGDKLTITIGDETIIYADVFSDDTDITINDKSPVNKETGGTSGIAKQIFDAVNRQLKRSVTKTESTIPQSEVQTVAPSDVRLKKNISKVGISPNGYNIYNFEYINQFKYGTGIYQGVMAQEVPHAQITVGDYYHVDYDKLDVTFKKI